MSRNTEQTRSERPDAVPDLRDALQGGAASGVGRAWGHGNLDILDDLSNASHLLAEGAALPYVAAQLGHAKPTTTLAHYAHFLPRGDRAWADRLEAARSADARLNARASKVATSRQTV